MNKFWEFFRPHPTVADWISEGIAHRRWIQSQPIRLTYAIILLLMLPAFAFSQTIDVEVYAPPMRIIKIRAGLWQAVEEPCEVTLTYPDGKMDAIRMSRSRNPDIAVIPPTYVRGLFRRAVDPCIGAGKFANGDLFTMNLPREPVVLRGFQVVAVAIDCPTEIKKPLYSAMPGPRGHWIVGYEVWRGSVRFEDCIADPVNLRTRVARETTARGKLTLVK